MARLFVPPENWPAITGPDVHYVRDVLRLQVGDKLELLDGSGQAAEAVIEKIARERIDCQVNSARQVDTEPAVKITLAQALPKGSKMDLIIEKAVELGIHKVIPLLTIRAIGKTAKLDRWRKLAKAAAEQSGRAIIPEIAELTNFADIIKLRDQFNLALIPWELEKTTSLKSILSLPALYPLPPTLCPLPPTPYSLIIMIGPEGGFSPQEIEQAQAAGWRTVSLGKRILRTETAGLATIANIMYELEQ